MLLFVYFLSPKYIESTSVRRSGSGFSECLRGINHSGSLKRRITQHIKTTKCISRSSSVWKAVLPLGALFPSGCLTLDNSQFLNLLPHLKKKKRITHVLTELIVQMLCVPCSPKAGLKLLDSRPSLLCLPSAEVTGTCELLRNAMHLKGQLENRLGIPSQSRLRPGRLGLTLAVLKSSGPELPTARLIRHNSRVYIFSTL